MPLDNYNFLPCGEARVLWSRFESLVGQQVFRLRVEGEAANIPSSICSLLSSDLSSPERITQYETNCLPSRHLQRNTNALEIDKQTLNGLPYIAQSTCPLLNLILLTIQELRSLDRYMGSAEVLRSLRNIKRSLLDVHKKALLLESQLHQYINPTLVTTLNKRSAKAAFEAELMCKLIDKLRKDSRESASDPKKRKRVCELTMKLKALLCRQKCEWQCVGRLKETLAIARDMKGVLKFICQLCSLLEHCSDASRRLAERPPPYEYCSSPYDSISKQNSSDALCEDLKLSSYNCPARQTQSSHSEVAISLSLDFTSDRDFGEGTLDSDDNTCTRTSSYRQRSSSSREVKSDTDTSYVSTRKARKSKQHTSQNKIHSRERDKQSKSVASVSSKATGKGSVKNIGDSEGKVSVVSKSRRSSSVPSVMEISRNSPAMRNSRYLQGSKLVSPRRSHIQKERRSSNILTKEAISEIIEALGSFLENRSGSLQQSGSKNSPVKHLYNAKDISSSDLLTKQTEQMPPSTNGYPQFQESPKQNAAMNSHHQYSEVFIPSALRLSAISTKLTGVENSPTRPLSQHSFRQETRNDTIQKDTPVISKWNDIKTSVSRKSLNEMRPDFRTFTQSKQFLFTESNLSKHDYSDAGMSPKDFNSAPLSKHDIRSSYQDVNSPTRNQSPFQNEARMEKKNFSSAKLSLPNVYSSILSKQDIGGNGIRQGEKNFNDAQHISPDSKRITVSRLNIDNNDLKLSGNNFNDVIRYSHDLNSSLAGKQALGSSEIRQSGKNFDDAKRISQDSKRATMSRLNIDNNDMKLSGNNLNDIIRFSHDLNTATEGKQTPGGGEIRPSGQTIRDTKYGSQDLDSVTMNELGLDRIRSSKNLPYAKVNSDQGRWSHKDLLPNTLSEKDHKGDRIQMSGIDGSRFMTSINDLDDLVLSKQRPGQIRTSKETGDKTKLMEKLSDDTSPRLKDTGTFRFNKDNVESVRTGHLDIHRQLAIECADIVQRRIASFSLPANENKTLCKSTSPPRAKREEFNKSCSRNSDKKYTTDEAEWSQICLGVSDYSVKQSLCKPLSKILSDISESNDYQSSSITLLDGCKAGESETLNDSSSNKHRSDSRRSSSHSRKQLRIASVPEIYQQRPEPSVSSRRSESSKYYMKPRYNGSDSSGSREPLLFSSQETDYSFEDRYSSYFCNLSKAKRPNVLLQNRQHKRSFVDDDSELFEDTTTTTDSCMVQKQTSSSSSSSLKLCKPRASSTRLQLSSRSAMDDTEGDIELETDLEDELELEDTAELFIDSESKMEYRPHRQKERQSSIHSAKSESQQSKRSPSRSSRRGSSVIEPFQRKSRRSTISKKDNLQTIENASPKKTSFYHPSDDIISAERQFIAGHESYRKHSIMSPSSRRYTTGEGILSADQQDLISGDTMRQSQRIDYDASQLRFTYATSTVLSPRREDDTAYKQTSTGSRKSSIKSVSRPSTKYHSPTLQQHLYTAGDQSLMFSHPSDAPMQSLLETQLSTSTHPSVSMQRSASASSKQSQILSQPTDLLQQSPLQVEPVLAEFSNMVEQSSLHTGTAAVTSPAASLKRDSSVLSRHSVQQSPERFSQITSPTHMSNVSSLQDHRSATSRQSQIVPLSPEILGKTSLQADSAETLKQLLELAQSSGMLDQNAIQIASGATTLPATSIQGDLSATSRHSQRSPQSPAGLEQTSRMLETASAQSPGSLEQTSKVLGSASAQTPENVDTLRQLLMLAQSSGMLDQNALKSASPTATLPATVIQGDLSAVSRHSQKSPQSPEVIEQASRILQPGSVQPMSPIQETASKMIIYSQPLASEVLQPSVHSVEPPRTHPATPFLEDAVAQSRQSPVLTKSPVILGQISVQPTSPVASLQRITSGQSQLSAQAAVKVALRETVSAATQTSTKHSRSDVQEIHPTQSQFPVMEGEGQPKNQSFVSDAVRQSPFQADVSEISRRSPFRTDVSSTPKGESGHQMDRTSASGQSPLPADPQSASRHSPLSADIQSASEHSPLTSRQSVLRSADYSLASKRSPSKSKHSMKPNVPQDIEEQSDIRSEMIPSTSRSSPHSPAHKQRVSDIHSEMVPSTSRSSPHSPAQKQRVSDIHSEMIASTSRSSPHSSAQKQKVSLHPAETTFGSDQESLQDQETESLISIRDTDVFDGKLKWWMIIPSAILFLMFLYYLICLLANTGSCIGCRVPIPNVFFYLINSAVHSVRLIHHSPAPV